MDGSKSRCNTVKERLTGRQPGKQCRTFQETLLVGTQVKELNTHVGRIKISNMCANGSPEKEDRESGDKKKHQSQREFLHRK